MNENEFYRKGEDGEDYEVILRFGGIDFTVLRGYERDQWIFCTNSTKFKEEWEKMEWTSYPDKLVQFEALFEVLRGYCYDEEGIELDAMDLAETKKYLVALFREIIYRWVDLGGCDHTHFLIRTHPLTKKFKQLFHELESWGGSRHFNGKRKRIFSSKLSINIS